MNEALLSALLLWHSEWVLNIGAYQRYRVHSACLADPKRVEQTARCTLLGYMERKKKIGGFLSLQTEWEKTVEELPTCNFTSIEYIGDHPERGTKIDCDLDPMKLYRFLRHRNVEIRFPLEQSK